MALLDMLWFTRKSQIGDIVIQALLEERLTDTTQITEHPIEVGAPISDHSYNKPSEVVIKPVWGNSGLEMLFDEIARGFSGGSMLTDDIPAAVYSKLLSLKESPETFDIYTTNRQYTNMKITSLVKVADSKTSNILSITVTCKQVLMVSTQATVLPKMDDQSLPAKTAEISNRGAVLAKPDAEPAIGGSVPIH